MNVGSRTADALLAALLLVAISACSRSSEGSPPRATASPFANAPLTNAPLPKVPPLAKAPPPAKLHVTEAVANQAAGKTPPELRADYIRTVQGRAAEAYRVEPMAAKSLRMRSPAQRLRAELSPEGVQITNTSIGGARGGLALVGLGCEQQRVAVRAASPRAVGNRGEYDRGELLEWYASGPLGLEHGFTLATPPPCRAQGGGAVVVELAVRGLSAAFVAEGERVELRDRTTRGGITYSDLFARDAKERTVAATMTVNGKRLLLHIDDAGAVYPLQIASLLSTQQPKLLASDGAAYDRFGHSVAVSGDTAVVGADRNDEKGPDAGAAYVFVRSGTTWIQQAKLTAADGHANDYFGVAVAISGDTLLVGAMFNDDTKSDAGAAYVFVRSGTSWTQQAKLLAADAASSKQLGISVALSGDTALVGAVEDADHGKRSGAAYVFVRSDTSWTQQAKLTAADGAALDQFGISLSVAGNTALIGAAGDDEHGPGSGSAYVFARSGTSWSQQAKLTAADGAAADQFGISVAVSGDTALVGANLADARGLDSGSAYVFVRSGTSWSQQAKLTAADGANGDNFGASVALLEDTALVGVPNDRHLGAASGSAYLFVRGGTSWSQEAKLTAADATSADLFGASVAFSDHTALVGAVCDGDLGSSSGSAYMYTPPPRRAITAIPGKTSTERM